MSPIEDALWCDIRHIGAVFYPQYPVGRRFVDFGNPCAKVAIECDGAEWHADKEADAARQKEIESLGWRVYRLSGRVCISRDGYEETDSGSVLWQPNIAYQVVREIANEHQLIVGCRKQNESEFVSVGDALKSVLERMVNDALEYK